ncbi:hypothetical protein QF000_000510 [Paraburkholderia atlantica]
MRQGDQQRAALRDLFDAAWRHADVAGQFRCGDASDMCSIVRYARLADHIIAGQSNPNAPQNIHPRSRGRTADDSRAPPRHSRRPAVSPARQDILVTVHRPADAPRGARIPGTDIARTLARHDAVIDVLELEGATGKRVGSKLLSCRAGSGLRPDPDGRIRSRALARSSVRRRYARAAAIDNCAGADVEPNPHSLREVRHVRQYRRCCGPHRHVDACADLGVAARA